MYFCKHGLLKTKGMEFPKIAKWLMTPFARQFRKNLPHLDLPKHGDVPDATDPKRFRTGADLWRQVLKMQLLATGKMDSEAWVRLHWRW